MQITFADISEFQENIDADAYIKGGHDVIICRTHNGYRPDNMMPGRVKYLRSKPFVAIGWYIYLAQNRDPIQQARDYISTIGTLRPNEFPILDHEEGSGNQSGRCASALTVLDQWAGFKTTLYSYVPFFNEHLGGTQRWNRPLWIAGYWDYTTNKAHYPADAEFWQYSNRERFPGLSGGVDASVFYGASKQFLNVVRPGAGAAKPAFQLEPSDTIVVGEDGDHTEIFVERKSGEVVHCWQRAEGATWTGWASLGTPGG
jgi:GH25 family lysozyme M1 (1,4-beta-N-acetylmuramidase)